MCDYRIESKKALAGPPLPKVRGSLGPIAHNKLVQVVKNGQARSGHDLYDGKLLPNDSLMRGHYMSDGNFHRALARMNAQPNRCQWCNGFLPVNLVRQHQQPHDHREHIQHHFHPKCWRARLLAVAAIFGHVRPGQLLGRGTVERPQREKCKTVVIIKKVFTLNRRPQNGKRRKWRS